MNYAAEDPELGFTQEETNQAQIVFLATEIHDLIS